MKRYYIKANTNIDPQFTFLEVNDDRVTEVVGSHIYMDRNSITDTLASDMFEYMNSAYKYVGGFKSFTDEDDLQKRSYLWYISYLGEAPENIRDLDFNKIMSVSVFRQKNGLKLVGLGKNRFSEVEDPTKRKELQEMSISAVREHIKFVVKHGWAEVSGKLEKMFKNTVGPGYIIDPFILQENNIFYNMDIQFDELHYDRPISRSRSDTILENKICYGKIDF